MAKNDDRDYLETLLTEQQAAAFIGHETRTLQKWRVAGNGPVYVNFSRRSVRYRRRDLLAFVEAHTCTSTSDAAYARSGGRYD
ncbi:MAG: DNA-binding protein [Alphaproteobacteria bacterium]|nr:DNA-binding protein [Alphaproteobacteria bacterium]